jgi:hypothetical protein
MTGHELAQEISIPRKARRLDAMCRFGATPVPGFFGALRAACDDRAVIFEHESAHLTCEAVASAWVGQAWMSWQRLKKRQGLRQSVHRMVAGTPRPPLAVVVADSVAEDLTGAIPSLGPTALPGLWATSDTGDLRFDQGALLVIDTSTIPASDGFSFWRWLGRARDEQDANARLLALLADPQLPMLEKARFLEAMMDNQFTVSETERETASQRVRREGREEGREEGFVKARNAILALATRVVPEAMPALQSIHDLDELQRAADQAIARKLGS